ncbi:MAG: hypothetical protein WAU96_12880 [Anaerolineae bacterium]
MTNTAEDWIPDVDFTTTIGGEEYRVEAANFFDDPSTGQPFYPELIWVTHNGEEASLTTKDFNTIVDMANAKYWEKYPDSD